MDQPNDDTPSCQVAGLTSIYLINKQLSMQYWYKTNRGALYPSDYAKQPSASDRLKKPKIRHNIVQHMEDNNTKPISCAG